MSCYEQVNEFRINLTARKELGYGAQGTVYPGKSLITKDPVAAKRRKGIFKEYFDKDEFEKEADLLLNKIPPHANIIKVLDFTKTEYEDKGIPLLDLWLITELCEFGNLKEFAYSRDLNIEQKIELMYQSALAVRHLHGCKPESVAHRDVKPENILLTGNEDNPTVKLCDFGSAKSVTNKDGKSVAMRSLAGTGRYQAPEQVECHDGHFKYDKQVDIFSLGITFLALLKTVKGTLMSPETIDYKGLGEIMWIKHKNRQAFTFSIHKSSDSAVVRAVKDLIENMIKYEPSSRLSAAEVLEELSKLRKEQPAPQPAPATDPETTTTTDSLATPTTEPPPTPTTVPLAAHTTNPPAAPTTDPLAAPTTDPPAAPTTDPQGTHTTEPPPTPTTDHLAAATTDPPAAPTTDHLAAPTTDHQATSTTNPLAAPTTDPPATPTTDPPATPATDPPATPTTDPPATPTTDPPATPTTDPPATPTTDPLATPTTDPPPTPTTEPPATPTTNPPATPTIDPPASLTRDPQPAPATDPLAAPTTDPLAAPSTDPPASPTTDPLAAPVTDPQPVPATDPLAAPTTDPLAAPSTDPPASPTTDPPAAPATDPPAAPTTDPQPAPATDPLAAPTTDPLAAPTTNPLAAPTTDPPAATATHPPAAPTIDPPAAPTRDPLTTPTTDPLAAPTTDLPAAPTTEPQLAYSTDPAAALTTDPPVAPNTDPPAAPFTDPPAAASTDPLAAPTTDPPATPTTDLQPSPTTDPPAAPTTDPPATPTTDLQPSPTTDPPATPTTDPPATPTTDPPAAPITDPPATPITDPPATPTTDPPAAPTTDPPAPSASDPPTAHVKDHKPAPATDPQTGLDTEEWQPGTKIVALFSFKAADDDNLDFRRNDVLTILKSTTDHNWYQAKNKSGKIGMIPRSYVRSKREALLQLQPIMWMHGKMPWRKARALLSGKEIPESMTSMEINALSSDKDVGTYLVHEPDDEDKMVIEHVYTLHVVRPDGKVGHYRIYNTRSGQLTINDKFIFDNLHKLVKFYEEGAHGLYTTLQTPFFNQGYLDFSGADWNISQSEMNICDKLYTGEFTDTHKGEYSGRDVFIRKRNAPYSVQDVLIEAAVMSGLSHKNLVQLIGVVLGDETLIVTEFLSKGRLSGHLRSRGPNGITSQDQMSFAKDVCSGMQYLEQNEIVHRRLMTHSVLLSEVGTAKVGDFTFAHPIGQFKRSLMKPRWTAPEVPTRNIFTSKSDVWSFGVLLWEIYSFGSTPYPGILCKDLHSYIMGGGRMEAPDGCPDEICHVMSAAWDMNPAKRPTFSDVCKILDKVEVDMYMTCLDFLEDWNISQSDVHVLDRWYTGEFIDTYKGEYSGRDVFIRKRKDSHSVRDARIEAAVMTGLSHKNLVQLIGVVLGDETLIVTEFLSKGRLSDYLRSQGPDVITSQDQMSFARDVCHGMQYLEQKNIVHKKLYARSVLLSDEGTAKVGDFIFAHPVDRHKAVKKRLIRWSAPEALRGEKVTSKSDVWSFGVLLWEIYSYGQKPYDGIPNKDIRTHLADGGRMEAPDECPGEIYHVMLAAWDIDPTKRPTFSDVCEILDGLNVSSKHHRSGPLQFLRGLFRL